MNRMVKHLVSVVVIVFGLISVSGCGNKNGLPFREGATLDRVLNAYKGEARHLEDDSGEDYMVDVIYWHGTQGYIRIDADEGKLICQRWIYEGDDAREFGEARNEELKEAYKVNGSCIINLQDRNSTLWRTDENNAIETITYDNHFEVDFYVSFDEYWSRCQSD